MHQINKYHEFYKKEGTANSNNWKFLANVWSTCGSTLWYNERFIILKFHKFNFHNHKFKTAFLINKFKIIIEDTLLILFMKICKTIIN